jgi:methionyl aminopeptidase
MVVTAEKDIQGARDAARCVVEVHEALVDFLRTGLTLAQVDRFVAETLHRLGGRSAFLNYKIPAHPPFPSHACISPNSCIVHGTHLMKHEPLQPGDLISIDIGVVLRGWIGDAAWTFAIEHASDEAQQLMTCGRQALQLGLAAIQPSRPLVDWARAVQHHVETECGFHLVRGLGGHGYGRQLHGPPFISNVLPSFRTEWPDAWKPFTPGMLIAVEPMIATSTSQISSESRAWPIFTTDGSLSVHYEANVLVTDEGSEDLTAGMKNLPDIVGL